jgi:hypothetical protein
MCDWTGLLPILRHYSHMGELYDKGTVDLLVFMPGCIERAALHEFQHHSKPYQPEYAPHAWKELLYGRTTQLVAPIGR